MLTSARTSIVSIMRLATTQASQKGPDTAAPRMVKKNLSQDHAKGIEDCAGATTMSHQ